MDHRATALRGGQQTAPLLRPLIATSWHRSRGYGLRRTDDIRVGDTTVFDTESRLVHAAAPVLDSARDSLKGLRVGGLLADAGGTLIGRFFGDKALDDGTERIGGTTGAVFDEASSGTNAIATCIETRAPVNVFGDEHYLDAMRGFDCYGLPILNPVTRRLEGVIDLMMEAGIADTTRRALQAFLDRMVHEISIRMLVDYDPDVQRALAAFTALTRRTDDPVVLLGRDFVLHNRRALDELSTTDIVNLESHVSRPGETAETTVTLESGREVGVQTFQLADGQPRMVRVRGGQRVRPPVPRPRATGAFGTRIDERIDDAAGSMTPVLIIGEPGTGRTRAAHRIAGPGAMEISAAAAPDGLADTVMSAGDDAPALIIEEIDRLGPRAAADAALLIRQGRRLVLTVSTDTRDEIGYLGGLCPEWLELPPLRERLSDLAALFDEMVRDRTGLVDAPVRVLAPVLELLRRYRWPGNLTELSAVVDHVLAQRSAGDITVADLPARYQRLANSRPSLTPFEQAEWNLIERTLDACDGNKVHTARKLGISRSKLYARLRYFGIS